MLKKFALLACILVITGLFTPAVSYAADAQTCIQVTQYGGAIGYICGTSTHTPVDTGLADNLGLIGVGLLFSSLVFLKISKRFKTSQV